MCNLKKILLTVCLFVSMMILPPILAGCAEPESSYHSEKSSTPTEQKETTELYKK